MESLQKELSKLPKEKPAVDATPQQPLSPVVQKKLDKTNASLARLTPESLEKLLAMPGKRDR